MRFKLTLLSAVLLSISLLSYTYDEGIYDLEKAYSNSQLENLNQDLEDLSRVDIKDRAVSLIEEKNIIEEKIEKGELDPKNSSSGPIIRLSNIYSELSLIQKILSGAGLFLLIDEIFGDDDGPRIPNILISSSSVLESSGTASVSLELSNPFNQEIVLNYSTSDDTAEAASDYTASTGTITFAPSETTKTISLDIINDGIFEVDETFNVNFTLGATSLGNLLNDTVSISINDDDDAPVFGIAGANVKEEDGTASITITKTNPVQMDITVNYATADGTALAGLDYVAANDSVIFAANETQKTISISIIEDSLDEDEESFSVSLTGASQGAVQESESAANVSIEDNDDTPSIRISGSNNIVEGDTLNINVTLAAESGRTVSVNLQNTDVQAIAGEDFNALNETVTFAPGETSKVVTLSTIDDAIEFFSENLVPKIANKLKPLQDVGLGYVKLGQGSNTLSGGEAQRVKLAFFLSKASPNKEGGTLFIFDEPTTGLHFHDIKKLLASFDALIEKGHSIIVIEHNLDLIKCADHIIDLGPEGGELGGRILAIGTPEEIVKSKESITAKYLKDKLIS